MTPEQRQMRARLAAYAQHKKHDTKTTTSKARETFRASFERQVDPMGTLPEPERQRRAEAARREYYTRLALKSSQARKKAA